ncbi:hypothetical protein CPT_Shady_064 [Streptomyces phage Shady]|uniref:Uncharacterized protein n=1 Tax=Streptomyces phage Shady TaxID=2767585 RepID=A0A873WP34_9CAUD|nr:hypothetical protein CPT_Shady_064 [Streptomyces phage Shady]
MRIRGPTLRPMSDGYDKDFARFTGSAEQVIAELEDRAQGAHCMGQSAEKVARYREAAQGVRDGSFSVRVGRVIYSVLTAPQTAAEDVPAPRDEKADDTVS